MNEDSANIPSDDKIPTPEIYKCCNNPQITYNAPVNINIEEKTVGSVDALAALYVFNDDDPPVQPLGVWPETP